MPATTGLPPLDDPIALSIWVTAQIRAGVTGQGITNAIKMARDALKQKGKTSQLVSTSPTPWWVWAVAAYFILKD